MSCWVPDTLAFFGMTLAAARAVLAYREVGNVAMMRPYLLIFAFGGMALLFTLGTIAACY